MPPTIVIDCSVIVCTRNRARLLEGALDSLARQTLNLASFEVVVVDNASSDDTAEVCESFSGALPLRRVMERTLGLNLARNRGIDETTGPWVAFLDDDARATRGWLEALDLCFSETGADAVGGPIEPEWERPAPTWLHPKLQGLLAVFDMGPDRCPVDRYPFLVGTNLALTRDAIKRFGRFHPDLDRKGANLLSFGDTEICARIVAGGGSLVYEPGAVVRHWIPAERVGAAFLARRSWAQGRSERRFLDITGTLGRNPSTWRALAKSTLRCFEAAIRGRSPEAARAAAQAIRHAGFLTERGR